MLESQGGFGRSIIARTSYTGTGTFVLAVPLDADFAVNTALSFLEFLSLSDSMPGVLVAFLSDEKNILPEEFGGITHRGLRDLLSLTDLPENWILSYLDIDEAPAHLVIHHGVAGYITPREIIEPFTDLLTAHDLSWSFRISYNEFYTLGFLEGPEILRIAWQEEINSFSITGEYSETESMVSHIEMAELFFEFSNLLSFPVLISDRHYSILEIPFNGILYAGEGSITILSLGIVSLFLLFFLIYSGTHHVKIIFHARLFFKHIWLFLLFFPLLILSIRLSGMVYSRLYLFYHSSHAGINYPGIIMIILLAFLFFLLPSPLLNLIRFPRRIQFYGFSSVFFIVLGLLFSVFFNFSFLLVFLWAFIFVFLGAMTKNPFLVFLYILMVPLPALGLIGNIVMSVDGSITELFISPRWENNITWFITFEAALLALPLFLLSRRGIIMIQKLRKDGIEKKPDRTYRLILIPILIFTVLGTMTLQNLLINIIDMEPIRRNNEADDSTFSLSVTDTFFQDSRIYNLTLDALINPVRFDIILLSENDESLLPLYSSQIPYTRENEGRTIIFHIGEHAPNPLVFEFAAQRNFSAMLEARAVYNTWNTEIDSESIPITEDYILTLIKRIALQ